MTEVNELEQFKDELNQINNELKNTTQVIEGLTAQLDASKQMYNDAINTSFQLKTQVILLQKQLENSKK